MRKFCVGIFFAIVFFTATYSSGEENSKTERAEIRDSWLNETNLVVQKIKDDQANEVFSFIEKNSALGAPNAEGVVLVESIQKLGTDKWFLFVPLLEKDRNLDPWKIIFEASSAAHFLPEVRSIVLKSYIPFSANGKAIVLLHEGYHAKIFAENPYEGEQDDREYCFEEVKVHTFQNKIIGSLGGEKYQAILEKEIKRIGALANLAGSDFSLPSPTEYSEGLAEALGTPASELEKDLIRTSVWIHAVFSFLENKFKKGAEEQKALFLRSMYQKGGVL